MSVTWSGPGRALRAHLDLFDHVDTAHTWITQHAGKVSYNELFAAPNVVRQRMRLMTSMADNLGPSIMVDGEALATHRDQPRDLFSTFNIARAVGLINTERQLLNEGQTHYVSHNISASVWAAAAQCDDEPLFPTDLPCPHGLLVLEYPLIIPDLHPETGAIVPELEMPIRAIGWSTQTVHARKLDGSDEMEELPGIFYALYTDDESWEALFLPSVRRALPEEYAAYRGVYEDATRDPLWCIDTSGWSFGRPWKRSEIELPRESYEQGDIHRTVADMRRFLLTYMRFCWQRILVPETYWPNRAERRQAMRAGLTLEDGYVKVLRLRRHVEAEARGERVEGDQLAYDHQWMVRGHPRRQWFPSLGPARNDDGSFNIDSHRLIWIEPHTKGNPYAPLIIGHDVTAVVR